MIGFARRTVEELEKKKYDRVYVQLTATPRMEFFNQDGPCKFTPQIVKQKEKSTLHRGAMVL